MRLRRALIALIGVLTVAVPMALLAVIVTNVRFAIHPRPHASEPLWTVCCAVAFAAFVTIHEAGHVVAGRLVGLRYRGFTIAFGGVGVFIEPTNNRQQILVSLGGPLLALAAEALVIRNVAHTALLWTAAIAAALLDLSGLLIGVSMPRSDSHKLLVAAYRTLRGHGGEPDYR